MFIVLCVGTRLCQTHPLAVWLLPESTTETVHSARLYGGSARSMTEASLNKEEICGRCEIPLLKSASYMES